MDQMANAIENGKKPLEVIQEFLAQHKRIIFNGDGYSSEWEEEALRRGLPNHKNTVDAMKCLKDEKNIKMLSRQGVYSQVELASRYEILLENYNKAIRVEALTALKMAKNEIYPATLRYLKDITKTALDIKETGIDNDFIVEDINELALLLSQMKKQIKELETKIDNISKCKDDIMEQAIMWRDDVFVVMNQLRETADIIETKVDESYWPIPNYVDLLFGI